MTRPAIKPMAVSIALALASLHAAAADTNATPNEAPDAADAGNIATVVVSASTGAYRKEEDRKSVV